MKEDKTGRDFYPLTYALCGMSFLCAVNIQELQLLGLTCVCIQKKFSPLQGCVKEEKEMEKAKFSSLCHLRFCN